MSASTGFWAVIPAAGIGSRMGGDIPKQYLTLGDRTVLEHTLQLLASVPGLDGICVALAADDRWWPELALPDKLPLLTVTGGAERSHSVLNCLHALAAKLPGDTRILVHDAARPCVRVADIELLMREGVGHPTGALLGMPVRDTMKRCDRDHTVTATVDRDGLWHALTPQMFPLQDLLDAISEGLKQNLAITDDASAMEFVGKAPLMIAGTGDNIKITRPEDLGLAAFYLQQQQRL